MSNTTATLQISLSWSEQNSENGSSSNTIADVGSYVFNRSWGSGLTNEKVNHVWHEVRTLTSGSSWAYDLTAMPRSMFSGSFNQSFSNVRILSIENIASGTGSNISIIATGGAGFTNMFNGGSGNYLIGAKSPFIVTNFITGIPVSASNRLFSINDIGGSGAIVRVFVAGI